MLAVTLPMVAAIGSRSGYMLAYQTYNSATFLFFVIALRPSFPAVLAGLTLMCLSHFTTTHLTGAFDAVAFAGIVTFYLTLSIFLAVSAYFLERTDRRNFLNQLRAGLLYRQLQHNVERDQLTGLLNRYSLARVREEMWGTTADGSPVSVILLDIDHFKRFNDVHGHLEGDACILAVASCINQTVGDMASVFRYGGEEILVLSARHSPLQLLSLAERIRATIENLAIRHGGIAGGCVTVSLGVTSACPANTSFEALLQRADEALYEAKRRGRNLVVLADQPQQEVGLLYSR